MTRLSECASVRKYLDSYVSNEMEDSAVLRVQIHLENCLACSGQVSETNRIRSALRQAVQNVPVPEGVLAGVRQKIRDAAKGAEER